MSTRRRSVRWIVVRGAVFLLLGAVVNVAVAWGCTIAPSETGPWVDSATDMFGEDDVDRTIPEWANSRWLRNQRQGVFFHLYVHDLQSGVGYTDEIWGVMEAVPGAQTGVARVAHRHISGWPLHSFSCEGYVGGTFRRGDEINEWVSGWKAASVALLTRRKAGYMFNFPAYSIALPLRPIWPDFAINTIFYATILWLLFAAPGTVRRWRRIRRGLCAKCAYPVGASDVCTECGADVMRARTHHSAG